MLKLWVIDDDENSWGKLSKNFIQRTINRKYNIFGCRIEFHSISISIQLIQRSYHHNPSLISSQNSVSSPAHANKFQLVLIAITCLAPSYLHKKYVAAYIFKPQHTWCSTSSSSTFAIIWYSTEFWLLATAHSVNLLAPFPISWLHFVHRYFVKLTQFEQIRNNHNTSYTSCHPTIITGAENTNRKLLLCGYMKCHIVLHLWCITCTIWHCYVFVLYAELKR